MGLKVGIIGYGYWGPNLVRNFHNLDDCEIVGIADKDIKQQENVRKAYPTIRVYGDAEDLILSKECNAIVIATPVSYHFEIALKALQNKKHVLIEKPIVTSVDQLYQLIEVAKKNGCVIMVDHTFLYNGAVRKIKQVTQQQDFGAILNIDTVRINLGIIQHDTNVLWDLACHDLSVINYLVDQKPYSVQVNGISHLKSGIENIAYLTLKYESDLIAHIHVSWSSPVKIRRMLIGGEHKMIVYDDIEPTDKLKIYEKNFTHISDQEKHDVLVDYRLGDVLIPKFNLAEPLSLMVKDFYNAVMHQKEPIANWKSGLNVVSILEQAQQSLKHNGKEVKIDLWDNLGQ